ncbi:MAG: aldehyde dehydrogenase family protein [Nannocystaceae bacterium]
MTDDARSAALPAVDLDPLFARQRAAFDTHRYPNPRERMEHIAALEALVLGHQTAVANAISADFRGRCPEETRSLEMLPLVCSMRLARRHLRSWMRGERRWPYWFTLPATARVSYQPLGVVGIVTPWNYPLLLSLGPAVAALAAGNRVMIKISEYTPRFGELLRTLVASTFDDATLTVILGNESVARQFTQLPLQHLFFTGSTAVGKEIMRCAAPHLTPVTLELGGKCPAIIGEDTDFGPALRLLWHAKLLNAGQSCVAPDHVYLPRRHLDRFVQYSRAVVANLYPTLLQNPDYTSIANDRGHRRLMALLKDAASRGATLHTINPGSERAASFTEKMAPTIVLDTDREMRISQEEVFGPVLPVLPYDTFEEVITAINGSDPPLAVILLTNSRSIIDRVRQDTRSGVVTTNSALVHFGQDSIPLGGVGPSGMGRYHGREGFVTFSNTRAEYRQYRPHALGLALPPGRSALKRRVLDFLLGHAQQEQG